MKIAIIGSRGLNTDIERFLPEDITLIISGGAIGKTTIVIRIQD